VGHPNILRLVFLIYMDDKAFFTNLLGLKDPWFITDVSLDTSQNRVDIHIQHRSGVRFPCPVCEQFCGVYDHTAEREFRHLDVCQMQAYLHVRVPRVNCPNHGIQQIVHGLAENNSTMTYELESRVLDISQECSVESTSRLLNLDWHTCWNVQQKAVERGFSRKPHAIPARIGIDEKAFAKGHKYETLVYDIDRGTVEYVCDDREQRSLESYYTRFSPEELAKVQVVAMDMWDPYIGATKHFIPEADKRIVFDRFHVMKHVVDAVDKVRKEEHKALLESGCDILKGTKYLFLWSEENLPQWRRDEFEKLRDEDLKVCRAWAIKENIRHLWDYHSEGWMRKYFKHWFQWATHSRLDPMVKAAHTVKAHIDNIVTFARHRVTNALAESINSKIEKVKRLACGFRNREHYRTAIYFHCGGLDLYPRRSDIALQMV
jgi:transposase